MVTINHLADIIAAIAGKRIEERHIHGPSSAGRRAAACARR
jgi:hypothetical protein